MKNITILLFILSSSISMLNTATAGLSVPGVWSNVPIFNQAPLEIKLGTFDESINADLLAMVLWNDGSNNRLDAVGIPFPYDGTNITSTSLENTATLFALGDICTKGTQVHVPYIKNFNIEVASYNGSIWSTSTVPGTTTNNFDSADCANTQDGSLISGHNLTSSEIAFYLKLNASPSFNFYGKIGSMAEPVAGPFDGAVRDTLVADKNSSKAWSLYQLDTGLVRASSFDTSVSPPVFQNNSILQLPAPTTFVFVKESFGIRLKSSIVFSYNADGNGRTAEITDKSPAQPHLRNLGAISNSGTQFNFQGGTYIPNTDEQDNILEHNILWGDWFLIEPLSNVPAETDSNYPLQGVGGPVSGCRRIQDSYPRLAYIAGPRVGSSGTDLHIRELDSYDGIFADGFESGNLSTWNCFN